MFVSGKGVSMVKAWWDDGEIDTNIKPVVEVLNRFPRVRTFSSCEGHGDDGGHVAFRYIGGGIPKWANTILLEVNKRVGVCLGCLRFELSYEAYFDCGNELFNTWAFQMRCRHDMSERDIIKESKEVWGIFVDVCNEYLSRKV
jgi:hypothetical protein